MHEKKSSVSVMVEYVLLAGVNDRLEHAVELADLLEGKAVMVNLIPYNKNVTAEIYGFESPTHEDAYAFGKVLIDRGLRARVRIERGADIAAACGQLALTAAGTKRSGRADCGEKSCGGVTGDSKGLASGPVVDIEDIMGAGKTVNAKNGVHSVTKKRAQNVATAVLKSQREKARARTRPSARKEGAQGTPLVSWEDLEQLCGDEDRVKSLGSTTASESGGSREDQSEEKGGNVRGYLNMFLSLDNSGRYGWGAIAAVATGVALVVYARRTATQSARDH